MTVHRLRFFSIRTAVILCIIIAVASVSSGYRTDQIYKLEKNKQTQAQITRETKVKKVAEFYMEANPRLWEELATYMAEATVKASEDYKVPLKIATGVVAYESEANPFARSRTGATGSSQVDFKAHRDTFVGLKLERDRYNPKYNIPAGMFLLQGYLKKYGTVDALQVYNLGEEAFKKGIRNKRYVKKVIGAASEFEVSMNYTN